MPAYPKLNKWDTMHLTTKKGLVTSRNATMAILKLKKRILHIPSTLIYMLVKISRDSSNDTPEIIP